MPGLKFAEQCGQTPQSFPGFSLKSRFIVGSYCIASQAFLITLVAVVMAKGRPPAVV
jgi:hypothetical protein